MAFHLLSQDGLEDLCDVWRGQSFSFSLNNRVVWYSVIYGVSRTLDVLDGFLCAKKPRYIILFGSCYLGFPIKNRSVVVPIEAHQEAVGIGGRADDLLVETAIEVIRDSGFTIHIRKNHLSTLSFVTKIGREEAESVDMETATVYYLANKHNIPSVAILGVSDYKYEEKIRFVEYEEELKDDIFKMALEALSRLI